LADMMISPFDGTFLCYLMAYLADLSPSTTDCRLDLSLMLAAWAISLDSKFRYSVIFLCGRRHMMMALPSIVDCSSVLIKLFKLISCYSCSEIIQKNYSFSKLRQIFE
jgi:hypothetical protein